MSHLNHHVLKFPEMLMVNIMCGMRIIPCHFTTTGFYHRGTTRFMSYSVKLLVKSAYQGTPFACNRKLLLFVPLDCVKRVTLRKPENMIRSPSDASAEVTVTPECLHPRSVYLHLTHQFYSPFFTGLKTEIILWVWHEHWLCSSYVGYHSKDLQPSQT